MANLTVIPPSMLTAENYYELEAAIFSGAQSVSYSHPGGNKSVTYRSMADMLALLKLLGDRLGLNGSGRPGRTYAAFSKGYMGPRCLHNTEGGECLGGFNVDRGCC